MKITPLIVNEMTSIRQVLEMDVTAHNRYLRPRVKTMTAMELLRNCHPLHRPDFARQLYHAQEITAEEYKSLVETPKTVSKYDN